MSLNQSKSEKSDSQYRKAGGGGRSGGFGQQKSFVGGSGRGGGGSTAPPLSTNSSSLSTSRSFKKAHNAQGVQSRVPAGPVNAPESNAAPTVRPAVQNGSHSQPILHAALPKPNDTPTQRSTRPIPRAPPSQSPTVTSDTAAPTIPGSGDGAKGFALQFGSISPGLMNGMQVPARTTSAPPNLDEQKRAQAQHDALRRSGAMPAAPAPKPEITKKEVAPSPQHSTGEVNAEAKVKRDAPAISAPLASQAQKVAVLPAGGISMPMPYSQPSVSMQFGGPNPQIQSQGMPATSLPMPMQMPLQMANPSQVQQVFMPHHLMQAQGMMHPNQSLGFNPQMGQLPPQLSSLGMNMPPQFSPQQPAKFGSTRKAVKITHPDTHEELRLDKRNDVYTDSRPHHNVPPQSQNVPTYTSTHPITYYSNSYVGGPTFFTPPGSLPLTSAQTTPTAQASRFNYSASQAPNAMSFVSQPASNSSSVNKGGSPADGIMESSNVDSAREFQNVVSSAPVSVTAKAGTSSTQKDIDSRPLDKGEVSKVTRPALQMSSSHLQKDYQKSADNNLQQTKPGFERPKGSVSGTGENVAEETTSSTSASFDGETSSTAVSKDVKKREAVGRSDSFKDHQKKPVKKGHAQFSHQVGSQSSSDLPPQSVVDTHKKASSNPFEAKKDHAILRTGQGPGEASSEVSMIDRAASEDIGCSGADVVHESRTCISSEAVESGKVMDMSFDHRTEQEPPHDEASGAKEHGEKKDLDGSKSQRSVTVDVDSLELAKADDKNKENTEVKGENHATAVVDSSHLGMKFVASSLPVGGEIPLETSSDKSSSVVSDDGNTIALDSSSQMHDGGSGDDAVTKLHSSGIAMEEEGMETSRPNSSSGSLSSSNKASIESNKTKATLARGKKKIKQILQKADAQGATSDLYMAYKGPEEKKESTISTEQAQSASSSDLKLNATVFSHEGASIKEKDDRNKAEPEDWEDAADVSTPKLESVSKTEYESTRQDVEEAGTVKKYSRDFLLTFKEQCTNLPEGFEITSDIANILMCPSSSSARVVDRQYPSPGRIVDRPSGSPRVDRRGSGMMDADRWNRQQGPFPSPRDTGLDLGYGPMPMGFCPGQGGNYGVLRNPRAQPPVQYPILSVPMQSVQRTDSDRWRNINFKGLMPSPQTPMPAMHKAERKYEVGKVSDEEEAKQRKLKGILNKLTPQNFDKLFAQVEEVNIDNVVTLNGVISQIFDKALMEPTFCEMYSNFCYQLSLVLRELSVDDEKITFKRLLLNKCQEEFEREAREEEEANKADTEDEIKLSAEEREQRRLKARRRMLGNIRLIGELYKKRMLTERIMHECIKKLLAQYPNSAEEDIESLCKLMSTIGEMIDHPKAKEHMDVYFDMMEKLSNNMKLSSRVRFMLKDAIDLRRNKWQQRRKVEGPKKIEEVHRDAAQERQAQSTRLNRGPSMGSSMRRGQPVDFGPRGSSMLSSPAGQMGSFRGVPTQPRSFGMQDVRMEERNAFDNKTVSVPLPQRSAGDDSITLGPQGGLARGMSIRGQPSAPSTPFADISLGHGDNRRTTGGLNGFSCVSERAGPHSREDPFLRHMPESVGRSQSNTRDHGANSASRDHKNVGHNMGRSTAASAPKRVEEMSSAQNTSSEKVWPEERLREKSANAIKEFYSAKDEKEVDLCVRELNAPNFYPSVISIWVTDSFERKDPERDMLNKLIVNLSKPRDGRLFMPDQLIKGFESVLTNLEDTVNDAPKAPDFLGRLFASVILENVVSLREIGGLLYEGGEEPGRLREVGLSGAVLGSTLESIKSERGEKAVKDMCSSCNLRLEDFRHPDPLKSRKLELFV